MCLSVWPTKFEITLSFCVKHILCLRILREIGWKYKFGKTGFKTCVLEKHFISYSCIFISYIQCFEMYFQKLGYFSKKMFFQFFNWSNLFFDQSKSFLKFLVSLCLVRLIEPVFQSIEHRESSFLKTQFWLVQTSFQNFSKLFFSLSDSERLHRDFFFVVFHQNSCKVSLSLSRYVYFTLPFALFFSFSFIISWFLGNFRTMLNLGFLINQALFYEFYQWVLFLQWRIHDLYWLIWSIWGFVKN